MAKNTNSKSNHASEERDERYARSYGRGGNVESAKGGRSSNRNNSRRGSSKKGKDRHANEKSQDQRSGKEAVENKCSWNALSWYDHYPELLVSSAAVPFPYKPGMVLQGPKYNDLASGTTFQLKHPMPGVCAIPFDFTIGTSVDKASPASIASSQLFFQIRRAFSGSLATDAPDVFMYTMGLSQLFSYIAFLKRVYKTITRYTPQNQYLPTNVLNAMFANFSDNAADVEELQRNKVQLWNYINTLIRMTDMYKVPAYMDIFKRHAFMCENVYSDEDTMMGQYYVFSPNGWYAIAEDSGSPNAATMLKYFRFDSMPFFEGKFTTDYLYKFGLFLVTSFNNWHDALTINGYILRAFEGVPFYGVELLGQDEELEIKYEFEVLVQIHNLQLIPEFEPDDITQDPLNGAIISRPNVPSRFVGNTIIDIPRLLPTAADVTMATRLTATIDEVTGELACGTEVCTGLKLFSVMPNGFYDAPFDLDDLLLFRYSAFDLSATADEWDNTLAKLKQLLYLQQWRFFPRIYLQIACQEIGNDDWVGNEQAIMIGEITNPTVVTNEMLRNIHRVVIYSEFQCFL